MERVNRNEMNTFKFFRYNIKIKMEMNLRPGSWNLET